MPNSLPYERQRAEFLLTLDDARAAINRGEGRNITQEAMQQLAHDVKERGRSRLLAELTTTPRQMAPRAETDLDDIWLYVAKESGSIEIANRLLDTITDRFYALASIWTFPRG